MTPSHRHAPFRGIACISLSVFVFMLSETITKWLTRGYPIGEIVFIRSVFFFIPIVAMILIKGAAGSLKVTSWPQQGLRAVLFIVSTFLIIVAIKTLPLADAVAFIHSAPLMTAVLAAPLLGERVGPKHWVAVLIGFGGVLIMTRPGGAGFQVAVVFPILAAAATALRDIVTRRMSATESTNAILAYSTAALILAAGTTLPFAWVTPTPGDVGLMAASGVLMGGAHYLIIEAFRWSEAAVVSPFKYTSIVWATVLGYLVFDQLPDQFIVGGWILIAGSGLYILYLENQRLAAK